MLENLGVDGHNETITDFTPKSMAMDSNITIPGNNGRLMVKV